MAISPVEKFNDTNPTATSNVRQIVTKAFIMSRTDTALTLKAVLPIMAIPLQVTVDNLGTAVSDAATTATITIFGGLGATQLRSVDVKGSVAQVVPFVSLNAASAATPFEQQIKAQYAETGTASTTGGPWLVSVQYIL